MQTLTIQAPLQSASNGLSAPESDTVDMQRLGTRCWKTLVNKGVPSKDAREAALAIAHFIYFNNQPSNHQKNLIDRYLSSADLLALQLA